MGQEIGVTPLQMATAYSVLANDGMLVKPHVVRELRSPDGAVVFQAKPETRRALKAETTAALRNNGFVLGNPVTAIAAATPQSEKGNE